MLTNSTLCTVDGDSVTATDRGHDDPPPGANNDPYVESSCCGTTYDPHACFGCYNNEHRGNLTDH